MSTLNECANSQALQGGSAIAPKPHQHHLNPNNVAKNLARGNSVVTLNQIYQHQNTIPARNRILSTTKSLQQQSIDLPGELKAAAPSNARSHEAIQQQQQQQSRLQTQSVQSSSSSPKMLARSPLSGQLTQQSQQQQQQKIRASSPIAIKHQPVAAMKLSSISPPVRIIQVARRHHQHHSRRSSAGSNRHNAPRNQQATPSSNYQSPLSVATAGESLGAWSDTSSEESSATSSGSAAFSPRVSPYNERHLNAPAEASLQARPLLPPVGGTQATAGSLIQAKSTSPNRRRLLPVSPQQPSAPSSERTQQQESKDSLPQLRHQYSRQSTIAGSGAMALAHPVSATLSRQSSAMSMRPSEKLHATDVQVAPEAINLIKRHRMLPQIPALSKSSSATASGQTVQSAMRPASNRQQQQVLSNSSPISSAGASAFSSGGQMAVHPSGNFQRASGARVSQALSQRQQQQLRVNSAPLSSITGAKMQLASAQQTQAPPAVLSQPIVTRPNQAGWRQLEKHHSGGSSGANSTDTPSPRSPIQTVSAQRASRQHQQQQEASSRRTAKYSASSLSSASTSTKSAHAARAESVVPEVDVSSHFTFDGHALSSGNISESKLPGAEQPLGAPLRSPGAASNSPRQESTLGGTLEPATTPRGRRLSSCGLGLRANFLMNKQHAISEFTPPRSLESSQSRSSTDAERNWSSQQHHVSPTLLAAHRASNTVDAAAPIYSQPAGKAAPTAGCLLPTRAGPGLPPVLLNRRPSGHGLPQRAASASETTASAASVASAYPNNLTAELLYGTANTGGLMNVKLNPATRSMIAVPAAAAAALTSAGDYAQSGWRWSSGMRADCMPLDRSSLAVDASTANSYSEASPSRLGAHQMHNALSIDVYQCNSLEEAPLSPSLAAPSLNAEPTNFLNVKAPVAGSGSGRAATLTAHFQQQQQRQQRGSSLAIPDSHLVPPVQQRDRQHSNVSTNSMPAGSSFGQFVCGPNAGRNFSGGNLSVNCDLTGGSNSASASINSVPTPSNSHHHQCAQQQGGAPANRQEGRPQRKFGLWAERIAAANSRATRDDDDDEEDEDSRLGSRNRSACQPDRQAPAGIAATRSNSGGGAQAAPSSKSRKRSRFERQRHKQLHKQRQQQQHHELQRDRRRSELRHVSGLLDEQQRRHSVRLDTSSCELSSSSESLSADELAPDSGHSPASSSCTRLLPAQPRARRPSVARFSVIPSSHRQQQQQQALLVRTANAFGARIVADQLSLADRLRLAENSANKLFRKVDLSPQRSRADDDSQPTVERARGRALESVRHCEQTHDEEQQSDDLSQFLRSVERRLTAELAPQERQAAARRDSNSALADRTVASLEAGESLVSAKKTSAGVSRDRSASAASRAVRRAMTLRSLVRTFSRRTSSCDAPATSHKQQLAADAQKYPNLLSVASHLRQRRSAECLSGAECPSGGQLSPTRPLERLATGTRSPQRGQSVRRRASRLFRRTKTQQQQQQQQQATQEDRHGNTLASSLSGSGSMAAKRSQQLEESLTGNGAACSPSVDQNHFELEPERDTKNAPPRGARGVDKTLRATPSHGEEAGAEKQLARMKSGKSEWDTVE